MDNRSVSSQSGKLQFSILTIFQDLLDKECASIHDKFMMALDDFLEAERKRCYRLFIHFLLSMIFPKAG